MNVALINGSPKSVGTGSTNTLLTFLKTRLDPALVLSECSAIQLLGDNPPNTPASLLAQDALVLAFPLYMDALPSSLFRLLIRLDEALKIAGPAKTPLRIYVLAQNGFYEGEQNHIALEIIRHWCTRCGFAYCQGIGCGAGGMLPGFAKRGTLGEGPLKTLGVAIETFAANIAAGKSAPDIYLTLDVPHDMWQAETDRALLMGAEHFGLTQADLG